MSILVPNLSIGNFASVLRMVQKVGGTAQLVDSPAELRDARKIILAGVGAFDNGMKAINDGGWADALNDAALRRKVPVLGICLGMQLMCADSEEGKLAGLGWVDARVRRFAFENRPELKVPHMGWSPITVRRANPILEARDDEQRFYFVHSFYDHGIDFTAAIHRDNILGVQFHPEKSHSFGMSVVRKFVEL
jgi:imidazole glycerol-phosphate synthase subunit HisH